MIVQHAVPLTWGGVLTLILFGLIVALVRNFEGPSSKRIRDGERKLMDEMLKRKPGETTDAKKE